MKKTALYEKHVDLGAKMAPFGGFEMPIQYKGIIKEHEAARDAAALFDTCHMGEIQISGPAACSDLNRITTCDVPGCAVGRCRNGFMCNERGGVIDDLIIYRFDENDFMMVVNAGTQDSDLKWIQSRVSADTKVEKIPYAKLDLQGPKSPPIMQKVVDCDLSDMKSYTHRTCKINSHTVLISRTGYTGEIGFELYCEQDAAPGIWNMLIKLGAEPAGLGARDTLRLEMCFPLFGHEMDEHRNPGEMGFGKLIDCSKEFVGSSVVCDKSRHKQSLVAIEFDGRRAARHGDKIIDPSGKETGIITSGSYSPSLQKAIALGYVSPEQASPGTKIIARGERNELAGSIVEKPFYKRATRWKKIIDFF
ncbi:MAG: glycine cleavage system aminomethyltransferase GcvT [Chitinivibrionales bacterium]|nr:glycine cleavage system aminomethyltransferase GcvT [Chitinivibrionales bacterium]